MNGKSNWPTAILLAGALCALTGWAQPIPNPILPGFYSDPSACTANGKYCLAVSSLQFFPAIPLFESVDLVHWKLVGHAIEKPGVVPLGGNPEFAGMFAPTIRFRNGRFYMTVGNHACFADGKPQGPVILYADRFEGPWSVPRKIEGLDRPYGDPSIDFVDGKCYFSGTTGFEVRVAEMDADAGRLLEKPRAVWSGTGGTYPEGQHVFRRGEWIYLMMAEGGTEYGHTHVIARSKSVYGPFAGCPRNPIAGHARLAHQGHPLQAVGHGDFVYDRNGNGHFICHAIRPQFGRHHTLGRETVIAPITWESDGWPLVNGGKGVEYVENTVNLPVRDWVYIRNPTLENYRIDEGSGVVALVPSPVKLTDADSPTFVGTRQVKFDQTFSGTLLEPPGRDVEAGLADYMGRTHHYAIAVENRGGTCVAFVRYQLGIMSFASEAVAIERFPVELKIVSRQKEIAFYANGRQLGKGDPRHISSETDSDSPYGGLICGFYAVGNASSGEVRFRYDGQEEKGR